MGNIDEHNVLTLLDTKILPGKSAQINFKTAKLYTTTSVEVPVIVERAKKPGPVILITAGIHGDEVNGVEIVRQVIAKGINKPKIGTVICIPLLNIFGFLDMAREFPGGRDLNRVFPGYKKGSLASMFAYQFVNEILPVADFCMDFHTGGASRFNAAQIRIQKESDELLKYAKIFNAPFTVYSDTISKSYRETCAELGKPTLLYEGGKSRVNDRNIAKEGVNGVMRILAHFKMLNAKFDEPKINRKTILIKDATWMRAEYSGLLHVKIEMGALVKEGEHIADITDPYGNFSHVVKASENGYIFSINQSPIVYQGDAIFHISED